MRSTPVRDLERQIGNLQAAGMLQYTGAQNRNLEEAIEPVPYFIIQPAVAQQIGTLVVPYVNLTKRGMLSPTARKAYGVVARPA